MTTIPRIDAVQKADDYSRAGLLAQNALGQQFQMRSHAHAVQALASRWAAAEESPTSGGKLTGAAFERLLTPKSAWLEDALGALAEVDDEITEDGLPEINSSARKEAERIIVGLARHPWAPTVYPTKDAEIAIHFKSPDLPNSVVILLNNHGQAECYAYTGGNSRRAHYDASSDLPDSFVMEQLRDLTPGRMAVSATPQGFYTSDMMLLAGVPTVP